MPRLTDQIIFARISAAMTPTVAPMAGGGGGMAQPATIQGLIDKARQKQPAKVQPRLAPEQRTQLKALNTR